MKRLLLLSVLLTGILFSCKHQQMELSQIEGRQITITDSIPSNNAIEAFIKPYRDRVSEEMSRPLSYAPFSMDKSQGDLNMAIGNMMADAVMEMAGPVFESRTTQELDIVILNHGGIRSAISQGAITMGTAFQVMPFENEVVVAGLSAKAIRQMVEYLISEQVAHPLAGIEITLDQKSQKADVLVKGQPIQDDKLYYVATNDYLYEGGDRMDFFSQSTEKIVLDYKIRNLLIDYFEQKDTIAPQIDNRFIRKK